MSVAVANAEKYLPPNSPVRASLYFMIKPYPNTFVFDTERRPAIFVAIDTSVSGPAFVNEISHELHHIGYQLERFFLDVLDGRMASADSVQKVAVSFFGVQGPGYTVGYLMARTIETTSGRPALMTVLCDPVSLMRAYQRSARAANERRASFPIWSEDLLRRLGPG